MPQRSPIERIEILERNVELLQALPERVHGLELQILQLRDEVRVEFSATREDLRAEMCGIRDELRTEMYGIRDELRVEMHGIRDELRYEIRAGDEATRRELRDSVQQLLAVIHETNQDTRRYMQVLHEDLVSRFATLNDSLPRKKNRKK